MNKLKIKVCGMRDPENISGVAAALPDFMGFIFYPGSARFVGNGFSSDELKAIPGTIKKVGVFVNELPGKVQKTCIQLGLQLAQLHGNESPEYCKQIQESGLTVFKAFSLDNNFNFDLPASYEDCCDYFLFDTKGYLPGGTGQKFNWQLLEKYQGKVPFFLSGGIGPDDVQSIRAFRHPQLFGIDINSGFEISPALKDVTKVKQFISEIRQFESTISKSSI